MAPNTYVGYMDWAVDQLALTIGQQTFALQGKNNLFPIPEDLARVLASQPQSTPVTSYADSNGKALVSREIGPGTVAAWNTIYSNAITPR